MTENKQPSLLDGIQRGLTQEHARRLFLYGTPGIGKSTFGAEADNSVFLLTEDGVKDIDCAKFPPIESIDQLRQYIGVLLNDKHDFETAVLDGSKATQGVIFKEIQDAEGVASVADIGYQVGFERAQAVWVEILRGFDRLVKERNISVIIIGHSRVEKFNNPDTEAYDRYTPELHKYSSAVVQEWADEVFFVTRKIYTDTKEEGFGKTRVRAVPGTDVRIMRTTEGPSHLAKSRLNIPDELPFIKGQAWSAYARYWKPGYGDVTDAVNEVKAVEKQQEKEKKNG